MRRVLLSYQSIAAWIATGGVAGWLAGLLIEGYGFGVIGNVVIGTLGALLASVAVRMLDLPPAGTLGSLVLATLGALALLSLITLIQKF